MLLNRLKPAIPAVVTVSGHQVPLIVRRHPRARRLSLRWRADSFEAILTTPMRCLGATILDFVTQSTPWLENQLQKSSPQTDYTPGMILPILGRPYELRHTPSARHSTWWGDDHLLIHAPEDKFQLATIKSIQNIAHQFLSELTHDYAERLGKEVKRVTLRDTRSRWGSCSSSGTISYCWRLAFAPRDVAAYVCAHEASHLLEMNHSPAFWNHVGRLCPEYKAHRQWLRANGNKLLQYGG